MEVKGISKMRVKGNMSLTVMLQALWAITTHWKRSIRISAKEDIETDKSADTCWTDEEVYIALAEILTMN